MNVSYLENHLKNGGSLPNRIVDEADIYKYKRDQRACNTLNKVLDTNYKAVYRRDTIYTREQWNAKHLSIETGDVLVVKQDNSVITLRNSEWFSVSPVKSHKWEF